MPAIVMVAIIGLSTNMINISEIYAQRGTVEAEIANLYDDEYGTTIQYCGAGQYTERCQHSGTGCDVGAQGLCN